MNQEFSFDTFAREYWEKKPGVFKSPLVSPVATQDELLDSLRKALLDPGNPLVSVLDLPGESKDLQHMIQVLPTDQSISDYISRVMKEAGSERFFVYLSNLQRFQPEIWLRAQSVLKEITQRVGLPANRVDLDFFTGRYGYTPSGIHKDSASLCFVLHGRKRILVWPYETFAEIPEVQDADARHSTTFFLKDLASIEKWRDRAIVLEAGPGEVIYWPSHYWHIGEDSGESASMITLAFFLPEGLNRVIQRAFAQTYPTAKARHTPWTFPIQYDPGTHSYVGVDLPGQAVKRLNEEVQSSLESALIEFRRTWSLRASMGGFDIPPRLKAYSEQDVARHSWKWRGTHPIGVFESRTGPELHAHGYSLALTHDDRPAVTELLDRLHRGESVTAHSPAPSPLISRILAFLASCHAIGAQ